MSILGWCIVHTTVRPVSTVFRTVRMTMAAARASNPLVGSSMKIMEGLDTNSTAIVNRFLCSVERPVEPGSPTSASCSGINSTNSMTSSAKFCVSFRRQVIQLMHDIWCHPGMHFYSILFEALIAKQKQPFSKQSCSFLRRYHALCERKWCR